MKVLHGKLLIFITFNRVLSDYYLGLLFVLFIFWLISPAIYLIKHRIWKNMTFFWLVFYTQLV